MSESNLVLYPPIGTSLILASASPRRRELIEQLGIRSYRVKPPNIEERLRKKEAPKHNAMRMAREKAQIMAGKYNGAYILAADTVVACGRRVLDKADDRKQASQCLSLLSGRSHQVIGAVVIRGPNNESGSRLVTTNVTYKRLQKTELNNYLDSGDWRGKAGGYAIQGIASAFIRNLRGSYSNVVGLPLHETYKLLIGLGFCYRIESGKESFTVD